MLFSAITSSTSISLLDCARSGQQKAWSEIVRLYAPLVIRWCRQSGIQNSDVDDVLQNVFMSVAVYLDQFGKNTGANSFRGWLWTITRSKIVDHFRKQNELPVEIRGSEFEQLCFGVEESHRVRSEEEDIQDLHDVVNQVLLLIRQDFSEQTWLAFWRTTAMDESVSQVAIDMGMSSAAICMCRARVLRRVKETLANHA
jgi:RNA polymerase sigma-70 factor (ECF subfamily)